MTGGLGDEAARLVGRFVQGGLQSRPEVLRHLAAAASSVAAALEALAAEAEQDRDVGDDPSGTDQTAAGAPDAGVGVQHIDVTD